MKGKLSTMLSTFRAVVVSALTFLVPVTALAQRPPVVAEKGTIVFAHGLGSMVGVEILRKAGIAVDAASAVVHPSAGDWSEGVSMLIQLSDANHQVGIDCIEAAPAVAHRDKMLVFWRRRP